MSDERNYVLLYKKKSSGEEKLFHRDAYRNYVAEDGTTMSKSESWTHWEFLGKQGVNRVRVRNLGKNAILQAQERLRSFHYANEIGPNEKLEAYIDGFSECLSLIMGRE